MAILLNIIWNSVIQRMSKISAGKDVSDTGMALNDVDKVLTKMGLSLKDQDGIMRDISDVLDEVAAKWNTWNKNQQNQVATAIAGGFAPEHIVIYGQSLY